MELHHAWVPFLLLEFAEVQDLQLAEFGEVLKKICNCI
jgi:hypothetical protein